MIVVEIKIWKYKELLHNKTYQFNNEGEARNYSLGLMNGMNLMNAGATGIETNQVENKPVCDF